MPTLEEKLAAIKAANATKLQVVTDPQPATPADTPSPAPATPTTPAPTIAERLAASKANPNAGQSITDRLKSVLADTKQSAALIEAESVASLAVDVPEGIYTLDERITKIEDFDSASFADHLSRTYQVLHSDQQGLAKMLEAINKNLRKYEELSYLLSPEQIGVFVGGMMKVTNSEIKTVKPKVNAAAISKQIAKQGGLSLGSIKIP